MDNWIARTHQIWKLIIGFSMILAFGVFFLLLRNKTYFYDFNFDIIATLTGAIGFFFLTLIRCPFCKKSVCWFFMKNKNMASWFHCLISTNHCPICKKEI